MAKLGRPDVTGENKRGRSWIDLFATAKYVSSSTLLTCCRRPAWPAAHISRTMRSVWRPGLFRRTRIRVGFNVAPLLVHNATQFALHGFKGVMDNFLERFVSTVIHLPFIGHKLVARRHGQVDATTVWIAFVMVMIGLFDCHIAPVYVITKSLESFCILQNEIVDLVRFFQTPI